MKAIARHFMFILVVLCFCPSALAQAEVPKKETKLLALIIGNSAYRGSENALVGPDNDAKDMARVLRRIGFKISNENTLTNLDRNALEDAATAFIEQVDAETIALVFYSGHGLEDAGKNYLVPVDANIQRYSDVASQLIGLDWILERLSQREARTSLVILDACRLMPAGLRYKKAGQRGGLAAINKLPAGTLVVYAASPDSAAMAAAPGERNSVFTSNLLRAIEEKNTTFGAIISRAAYLTKRATNKQQSPWASGIILTEDFDAPKAANAFTQNYTVHAEAPKLIQSKSSPACVEISEQLIVNGISTWSKKCL
jgi:uncharacterized caspase-like protein